MGAFDFMKGLVGIEDDSIDEITQEEIDAERKRLIEAAASKPYIEEPIKTGISTRPDNPYGIIAPIMEQGSSKPESKASINASGPFKMVVIEPKRFDECSKLVDNLKMRKPVIINLEKVETELARKMFDLLSGATYALSGNVQRVTQNIFVFAPANVGIDAQLNRDNTEAGYTNNNNSSPWGK